MLADEQAIECVRAFGRALLDGDADGLDPLLVPNFTYTHMSSYVEPKHELLAALRGGRRNRRMDFEDLTLRRYPEVAIVNGVTHVVAGPVDQPLVFDSRLTAVMVPVEGEWKLVAYHSTRVPEELTPPR